MLKKWLYVIGWSAALLVGTVPNIIKGTLRFSLRDMTMGDVCDLYMFPVLIALALLMADVLYMSEQEKAKEGRVKNTSVLIVCVMAFLFAFVFSMWLEAPWACWVCFAIAWISMTALKFSKTETIKANICPEGNEVPE